MITESYTESPRALRQTRLVEIIQALARHGLPEGFSTVGATVGCDAKTGEHFITNEDVQIAYIKGSRLELWDA